jgi:hypothetical protein
MNKTLSFYDEQFYMYSRTNSVVIRKTQAQEARCRLELYFLIVVEKMGSPYKHKKTFPI